MAQWPNRIVLRVLQLPQQTQDRTKACKAWLNAQRVTVSETEARDTHTHTHAAPQQSIKFLALSVQTQSLYEVCVFL
jgi:hypothetical protein